MQDLEFILGVSHLFRIRQWHMLIRQQVPHKVQQIMSGKKTLILSGAIPAFELFMSRWEKASKDHPHLKDIIKPGLDWAYLYYKRMDRTRAYIIAMCK